MVTDGTSDITHIPENDGTDSPIYNIGKGCKVIDTYKVDGVYCELSKMNGTYYIKHPLCSLVGMGETLLEAETDLRYECGIMLTEFSDTVNELFPTHIIEWMSRNAIFNYMEDGQCKCSNCQ